MTGFGKDGKGQILYEEITFSLGTLADNDTDLGTPSLALTEDFRLIKTEWVGYAAGIEDDRGPLIIGIADGELTAAEISECLNSQPADRNDNVELEESHRPVWILGQIGPAHGSGDQRIPSSGLLAEFSLRWTFPDPEGWNWFVHNKSGGALAGGMYLRIFAKHFGVWIT